MITIIHEGIISDLNGDAAGAKRREKMIKAALFDMDGTMYDTERISSAAWVYACSQFGYPMTFEQTFAMHGHNAHDNGILFASWFGDDAPYQEIRDVRSRYMEDYFRKNPVPVKPGLFELFSELRSRNIRITVATGTAREIASGYWESTGVLPWISASVCGNETHKSKPDPEVFLKAAALSQAKPEECIVFEDSRDGVFAARAAGTTVFLIPDTEPVTDDVLEAADYILPSLLEAVPIIHAWPEVPD